MGRECKGKCHFSWGMMECRAKTDDTDDCATGFRPEYGERCDYTSQCQHVDDVCCFENYCSDCCALRGTSTANVSAITSDDLSDLPVCLADRDIVQRIAWRCCLGTKFWACNAAPTELVWS